jgi:hypothetical protein
MEVRPIDGNALIEWFSPYLHADEPIQADVVIEDIRSMPTLTPPNEALTLEELREMKGQPVWTVTTGIKGSGRWELVCDVDYADVLEMASCVDGFYDIEVGTYGSTWAAYRLRELAQADREGRCVVLPCKIGDTIYQVDYMTHGEALRAGVPEKNDPRSKRKFGRRKAEYLPLMVREKKMVKSLYSEFGKSVFLTRTEAEAALRREQDG